MCIADNMIDIVHRDGVEPISVSAWQPLTYYNLCGALFMSCCGPVEPDSPVNESADVADGDGGKK